MATFLFFCAMLFLADSAEQQAIKEPALRVDLLRRVEVDQEARNALISGMKKFGTNGVVVTDNLSAVSKAEWEKIAARMKSADDENTAWLKAIVDKHGWPTISLVGKDGAGAAWLLVQHADAEAKFQRRCLDLMTNLPKEEVLPTKLAYLTDRVLLAEGKEQIYGTQFTYSDGKWKPRPLADEANVDKRRAEAGLPPLAEYVKQIEAVYGADAKE